MLRRPRRNRKTPAIRGLVRETSLSVNHLVYPLFVVDGKGVKEEIASLPGNFRFSPDEVLREIESCLKLGLHNFIILPAVAAALKDTVTSYS